MNARDKIHNIPTISAKLVICLAHQNDKRAIQRHGYGSYLLIRSSRVIENMVFHEGYREGNPCSVTRAAVKVVI